MYKILIKLTSKTKQEGLARGKRINRFLLAFLAAFLLYLGCLMVLKAEIFRHPNQSPNSDYSKIELAYLVVQSIRMVFMGTILVLFV